MPATLILKFGAIGDVVMTIPGAYQLHLRGHTIDWVCGSAVLPILKLYPWIHPIPVNDRAILKGSKPAQLRAIAALWRAFAGKRYDTVATLYYDRRYRVLALPVRARRKFQLSMTDRRFRLLPGRHHTDEYARLLLDLPDEHRPTQLAPVPLQWLPLSALPRTGAPRVVLAPAGAKNMLADDMLRRWPSESYVALATLLVAQNVEVVLIGGLDDQWVTPEFAHLPVTNRIGTLGLVETLSLLHEADLLVTHDTGPLHLAGMTQTGLISLFGPTDPRGRLPQRAGTLALWGGEGFACRPCYDGHTFAPCPQNDCIRQYTPAMVFAEVMTMLADRARGHFPPPQVATPRNVNGDLL